MEPASSILTYPGVGFARVGDVGIVLWHGDPTLAANRWLVSLIANGRRAGKGLKIGVQLIDGRSGLPDAEARRYVQQAFSEELPHVRRFINAPLGDSMKQSLVRTILRGMATIGDKAKVIVIASTIDEALDLVAPVASPETPSRTVLSRTIDQLFAEAGIPRPD